MLVADVVCRGSFEWVTIVVLAGIIIGRFVAVTVIVARCTALGASEVLIVIWCYTYLPETVSNPWSMDTSGVEQCTFVDSMNLEILSV